MTVEESLLPDTEKQQALEIRRAAMDLLYRREHSFCELVTKLTRRFSDKQAVELQVQRLADENLQSDGRFVESWVNGRKRQGKGPARIRQELQQKGVSSELVGEYLEGDKEHWYALAEEVYLKKFGGKPVSDHKDRARRMRFLQYRGFDPATVSRLVNHEFG